jgi:hypothetical protein
MHWLKKSFTVLIRILFLSIFFVSCEMPVENDPGDNPVINSTVRSLTLDQSREIQLVQAKMIYSNDGGPFKVRIEGDVAVKNLSYFKKVKAVWWNSLTGTWADAPAVYSQTIENNREIWKFKSDNLDYGWLEKGVSFRFALSYQVNGKEYWDNNQGSDYRLSAPADDTPDLSDMVIGKTGLRLHSASLDEEGLFRVNAQVENLSYNKTVRIVYSTDRWKTVLWGRLNYESTQANGQEIWSAEMAVPPGTESVVYALNAQMNGKDFWDNAYSRDYECRVSALSYAVFNRVRTVYWVAADQYHDSVKISEIRNLILQARDFYSEEMVLNGYKRPDNTGRSFRFETDLSGQPKIWLLKGDHELSWYQDKDKNAEFAANDEIFSKVSLEFFRSNVAIRFVDTYKVVNGLVTNSGNWGSGNPYQGGVIQGTHILGIGFKTVGTSRPDQLKLFSSEIKSGLMDWSPDETGFRELTCGEYSSVALGVFLHELGHGFGGVHLTDMKPPVNPGSPDVWLMQNGFRRYRNRFADFEGYPTKIHSANLVRIAQSKVFF